MFNSPPWSVPELNHRLCLYAREIRRTDGKNILSQPSINFCQVLCGMYMRTVDPECPNFIDRGYHNFKELHAIDNLGCQHPGCVGTEVKHVSIVSHEEEGKSLLTLACLKIAVLCNVGVFC